MTKEISIVHHADRRTDVMMPYAPGIVVRRGQLVFLSGVTAAAVYHSHPHREEEFDLPSTMREQAVLTMENLKKTLEAAGCTFADLVSATRFLTDVAEHLPDADLELCLKEAYRALQSGGYLIVAERRRASAGADMPGACRWIRRELAIRGGVAPTAVVIVSPGSIPKTPSGKLQRKRLGRLHGRGELAVETELRFGGRP